MLFLRQLPPRALPPLPARDICISCSRRFHSKDIVKENDVVLLKNKLNSNGIPILTSRLRPGKKIELQRDFIYHDDILGKAVGFGFATSRKRVQYRIHRPTLGEYTDSSPRIVTPIYSKDANLIVSLLDIHPTVPGADVDGKLEIFEAGTGHGALTLHLAKAIHGANTAAPAIPGSTQETDDDHPSNQDLEKQDIYEAWRSNRRAIIHTLDVSAKHSSHAQQVVKNFRDGVYFPHIDFHVGNIDTYLTSRLLQTSEEPFLEHAILDLPNTHENLDIVGKALKPNGTLITFCPSITQINACVMHVKEKKIPFFLDNVLELGGGVGVGGREWDVRPVKPRAAVKAQPVRDGLVNADGVEGDNGDVMENPQELGTLDGGWEMVCRPKVGVRTAGGGFVGVWRRMLIADS